MGGVFNKTMIFVFDWAIDFFHLRLGVVWRMPTCHVKQIYFIQCHHVKKKKCVCMSYVEHEMAWMRRWIKSIRTRRLRDGRPHERALTANKFIGDIIVGTLLIAWQFPSQRLRYHRQMSFKRDTAYEPPLQMMKWGSSHDNAATEIQSAWIRNTKQRCLSVYLWPLHVHSF